VDGLWVCTTLITQHFTGTWDRTGQQVAQLHDSYMMMMMNTLLAGMWVCTSYTSIYVCAIATVQHFSSWTVCHHNNATMEHTLSLRASLSDCSLLCFCVTSCSWSSSCFTFFCRTSSWILAFLSIDASLLDDFLSLYNRYTDIISLVSTVTVWRSVTKKQKHPINNKF